MSLSAHASYPVKLMADRFIKIETIMDSSKSPTPIMEIATPMPGKARFKRQNRVACWRIMGSGARLCLKMIMTRL